MTPVDIGGRLVPALLVRDMSETLAFYHTLGFTLTGCYPNPIAPTWAAVSRASATLQFHTEPPLVLIDVSMTSEALPTVQTHDRCSPPTSGVATMRPSNGGETGRVSGGSLPRARCARERT